MVMVMMIFRDFFFSEYCAYKSEFLKENKEGEATGFLLLLFVDVLLLLPSV